MTLHQRRSRPVPACGACGQSRRGVGRHSAGRCCLSWCRQPGPCGGLAPGFSALRSHPRA